MECNNYGTLKQKLNLQLYIALSVGSHLIQFDQIYVLISSLLDQIKSLLAVKNPLIFTSLTGHNICNITF